MPWTALTCTALRGADATNNSYQPPHHEPEPLEHDAGLLCGLSGAIALSGRGAGLQRVWERRRPANRARLCRWSSLMTRPPRACWSGCRTLIQYATVLNNAVNVKTASLAHDPSRPPNPQPLHQWPHPRNATRAGLGGRLSRLEPPPTAKRAAHRPSRASAGVG